MKLGLAAACLVLGCAGPAGDAKVPAPASPPSAALSRAVSSSASPSAVVAPASRTPTLLITDPAVLAALEARGLSLGALMGDAAASRNDQLSGVATFVPLLGELERELDRARSNDPLAGVDVARYSHRLFDKRFLRLDKASFRLAGVVNRPDRAAFAAGSCGETRLIYRLKYSLDGERTSKLPMTIGVELTVPRGSSNCAAAMARWLEPPDTHPDERARWLRSEQGPLTPARVQLEHEAARVVVNLQLVRWPSTVRPDLGGHAEYLLRSFRPQADGRLAVEPLENTIEPARFQAPERRARLTAWLASNAKSVDDGTALLPDELLAVRAISVTPRGLSRLANRPFTATLTEQTFAERDFSAARFAKSSAGLLRRLDQLSCQGCHEARSVAGFHLLGEDDSRDAAENSLAVPVSPQVLEDMPRRRRIAAQMLAGVEPDLAAPLAERASTTGGYGEHCGLGRDPSFADWTCAEGLICSAIEASPDAAVGQCLPVVPQVGDACERGSVVGNADRLRDRMSRVSVVSCPSMVCNRSRVGFPGGMCTADCGAAGSECGAIAILDSFNACLARGESFLTCIRGNTSPAGLRACGPESPCRDDYVCARSAEGGVCLPPYFVFQLRVDGHSSGLR